MSVARQFVRIRVVLLGLWLPYLLEMGLGTSGRWLDLAATPAAWLATVPAQLGWPGAAGLSAILLLSAAARGTRWADRTIQGLAATLSSWGSLAALAALLATARPWAWVAVLAAFLGRSPAGTPDPWTLRPSLALLPGALAWAAATRLRPYGPGLLTLEFQEGWASVVGTLPTWAAEALAVPPFLVLALLLWRRGPPRLGPAWVCAGFALLVGEFFGTTESFIPAILVGAVAGAWPPPRRGWERPVGSLAAPHLLLAALASLGASWSDRWACDGADEDPRLRWLFRGDGGVGIAAAPGNVAAALVLVDRGGRLVRYGPGGVEAGQALLAAPGGALVSPVREGGPLVRVLGGADGLLVQWWDPDDLTLLSAKVLAVPCASPSAPTIDPATDRVWVPCEAEGTVYLVPRGEGAVPQPWSPGGSLLQAQALGGGTLLLRGGPSAQAVVFGPDQDQVESAWLGPFAEGLEVGPGRYVVARGPLGLIEIRTAGVRLPGIPGLEPPPLGPGGLPRGALERVTDRGRVSHWADRPQLAIPQHGVWVSSPVEGRVTLIDTEVTWLSATFHVGAPVRAMVSDPGSGTLFGVNRCGAFEIRVPAIDPWAAVADPAALPGAAEDDP